MNQSPVGQSVRGRIESDRWYDVKIELAGNRIRCYLDGKLLHDVTSTPPQTFFVNAGRDNPDGTLIVKAINMGTEPQTATVRLRGAGEVQSEAECTVLTSARFTDNNSLASPAYVAPRQTTIAIAGTEFAHEFPPRSLSILRIQPKSQ
jgi:alpha-L-arabinofuranosidase